MTFDTLIKLICIYTVDALIGLRPPSGVPHYWENNKNVHGPGHRNSIDDKGSHIKRLTGVNYNNPLADPFSTDSVNKLILQRTYRNHTVNGGILQRVGDIQENIPNLNNKGSPRQTARTNKYNTKCHPVAVNRCGIQFLKAYLHNSSIACQLIQIKLQHIDPCLNHNPRSRVEALTLQLANSMTPLNYLLGSEGLEKCLRDRMGDTDTRNIHFILYDMRTVKASTANCPSVLNNYNIYRKMPDQLFLCEENILECTYLTYKALADDIKSCDSISKFTSCVGRAIGYKSEKSASVIFNSILSLTRTCVHTRLRVV